MRRKAYLLILSLAVLTTLAVGLVLVSTAGADHTDSGKFMVTVTNLTKGQIMSPPVVATHDRIMDPLFVLGSPASAELAGVAEDAVNGPLEAALAADPHVNDVVTITGAGGPILPGESASAIVNGRDKFDRITLVGMLVTTNDAFYALNGVKGPKSGAKSLRVPAYDAGTEVNNELCAFIPGPPCGNPGVHDTDGAEGYVYINSGIHGIGDLAPAEFDWRNPVALVQIRRIP